MRVLIHGSSSWHDLEMIETQLSTLPASSLVMVCSHPGASALAAKAAQRLGLQVEVTEPRWTTYARRAAMVAMHQQLKEGPDQVWVFWDGTSQGAKHAIEQARRSKVALKVWGPSGPLPEYELGGSPSLF